MKPTFEPPTVTRYGTIAELTQGGTAFNQDTPFGNDPNSAYPGPPGS